MSGDSKSYQDCSATQTLACLAHDYQQVFNWLRDEVGSIAWRPSQLHDFRNLWVVSTAERLVRWDSRHPNEIFRTGFEPRASPSQLMDDMCPNGFDLRKYAEHNVESIFVGTTRTRPFGESQVIRWKPYASASRTHFEYEVFAFGGIDINRSLGDDYRFSDQHEIAFPGGIRPESIRSAIEYEPRTDNPIRFWYNQNFSPHNTVTAPDPTSSLPLLTQALSLAVILWTPEYTTQAAHGHTEHRERNDSQYVDLMRDPGEPVVDPLMSSNSPSTGSFFTGDIRSSLAPTQETSKHVFFSRAHQTPPGLPMGLTLIDARWGRNIRVHCFDNQVNNTGFTVSINTWGNSTLFNGSCVWMEVPPSCLDFQYGEYSTADDHPIDRPQKETKAKISFRQAYAERPKVVVWFTLIHMDHTKDWRVKAYVTDITPTDFVLHLDTWDNSRLYSAKACWVAYPAHSTNINSGSFNTMDKRPAEIGWIETKGKTIFRYLLGDHPRVLAALNWIEVDCKSNLRVQLKTNMLPKQEGFEWTLNTWLDKNLYSAGASWIAWK